MIDRRKEIAASLAKLSLIKDALTEMYSVNQEIIRSLSWQNHRIEMSVRDVLLAAFIYGSLTDEEIKGIPEEVYPGFMGPLDDMIAAGDGYRMLKEKTKWVQEKETEIASSVSAYSAVISVSAGDTAVGIMGLAPYVRTARFSPRITEYLKAVRVDQEIAYIKTGIGQIDAQLADDFKHFLDNYFASGPSESKYQELIGSRSLFFQKTIFAEAERRGIHTKHGGPTRRDQIEAFIYGSNPAEDPAVADAVSEGVHLWNELSGQDSAGMSVKTGNVSPMYAQLTFNKIIIVFSTLLKERELHYAP